MRNWKIILSLALPSVIAFATATFTGTISLIMVGAMGATVIAVVGVSNIIMYNVFAIFSGIGHTLNYLVAQNFGANEMKKAVERMNIAMIYLCVTISALCIVAGFSISGMMLELISGSGALSVGADYLQIRFFAMAFGVFNFLFQGFFRGIGDTKTPMVFAILTNVAVVFFTYALTYGNLGFAEMGLRGAGWAVFIGEALAFIAYLYVYFIRLHAKYKTRTWTAFNFAEFKLIIKESGKLGVQEFALSFSMFVFTIFVARLGVVALAANEIALNVMSFGFMPAFAFGATATILVGQHIGKGDPVQARRLGTETALIGSVLLLLLGVLEFFSAGWIVSLYTDDLVVAELATRLIMISAFWQLFDGLLNFYAGGLRGIGDTTFLLWSAAIIGLVLFIPLSYVLIFTLGLGSMGAWYALYTFLTLFAVTIMIRFYKTDWTSVRMKKATS